MLEIEIKSSCDDLELLKEKIIKSGGIFESSEIEHDVYYNHPCRDFKKTDEAFRIRHSGNLTFLTYKGPKIGEKTKTRFEKEILIGSAEDLNIILNKLGFEEAGEIIKERETYKLSGITVCLDKVNGLGSYAELEIISDEKDKSEKLLFETAGKLGLNKFERRSYLELILLKQG